MGFWDFLRAAPPPLPGVDALTFDVAGSTLEETSETMRGWLSEAKVATKLRLFSEPIDWPFDLRDPGPAAAFYRAQCADNGGVMLSVDPIEIDGVEALRGLFKYRAPIPRSLALYYVGIVWIPFERCSFQINVEAMERGTTGAREAAVMLLEGERWPKQPGGEAPILVKSAEEMFERMRATPLRKLPSDDERHDAAFADHPLSQVRARLAAIVETATFAAKAKAMKPFRVRG